MVLPLLGPPCCKHVGFTLLCNELESRAIYHADAKFMAARGHAHFHHVHVSERLRRRKAVTFSHVSCGL
jgi:hypothetical protein